MASMSDTATDIDELHGTRKAARIMKRAEQTIRNLCRRGELRAIRTSSGRFLVSQQEIERYLKKVTP